MLRAALWLAAVAVSCAAAAAQPAGAVQVEVYGASLCPDSRRFIALLDGLLASGSLGEDQVQVASTASGRVRNATGGSGQWDLQCQHGPEECYFNRWWGCGVERHPNQTVWVPFVSCLLSSLDYTLASQGERQANLEAARRCAAEAGLDADALQQCADGPEGAALEAAAAEDTWALDPQLTYVPWVLVNGAPLGAAPDQVGLAVCAELGQSDTDRPPLCDGLGA